MANADIYSLQKDPMVLNSHAHMLTQTIPYIMSSRNSGEGGILKATVEVI